LFEFEITARCVYVLKLEGGFIFVGSTATALLEERYRIHRVKNGSSWTNIHNPIQIIEVISAGHCTGREARDLENSITLQYMAIHGWRNVRGGDFSIPDDLLLYDKLILLQTQYPISFLIERPENVPAEHRPTRAKRNRKSKSSTKFQTSDVKKQRQIKASIKNWIEKRINDISFTSLEDIDCENLSITWLKKTGNHYELTETSLPDIKDQFLFFKEGKLKRISMLEQVSSFKEAGHA
jgi:predicted GIY-YIG superfamily endonuclease